jgi:hypothetical protein
MSSGGRKDDPFKSDAEEPLEFETIQHSPPPSPRRTLRMAVLLLGLMVAGGGLWFLVGERGETPVAEGELPVVRAPEEPVKVRPEQPGGMKVPHRDKLVYDRMGPQSNDPEVERLLPEPEQPMARPEPSPEPSRDPAVEAPEAAAKTPSEALKKLTPPPPAPMKPVGEAAQPKAPSSTRPAPAKSVAAAEEARKAEAPPETAMEETTMETSAGRPPAEAAPQRQQSDTKAASAAPKSTYQVQIAALRSRDAVEKEWSRLRNKHGDLLGSLTLNVERADLGPKGVFYRLRAGPLADRSAAGALCDALKKRKLGCMVVGPRG